MTTELVVGSERICRMGRMTPAMRCTIVQTCRIPTKPEYDFSKAKRGPVISVPKEKTRITIRLDEDVIA